MTKREEIIKNYVDGYNAFDIDKMVRDFNEAIIFKNINNDEVTIVLNGIEAFRKQADQAKSYFESRLQTIKSFKHKGDTTEIEIDYIATLASDLPNGLKKGEQIDLSGRSIFKFSEDQIVELIDIA